jgi:hypothetical protein
MNWKEYPSSSERTFAFAILRMVDLSTIDLNVNEMCNDLSQNPQECAWLAELKLKALSQKYRDDVSAPIFDVSIVTPDDWYPHSFISFRILRQVRMDTYDFEGLSRAHDKVSNDGRHALVQWFFAFGSKYMDSTHYEKNSSGAGDVDAAENNRLQKIVEDEKTYFQYVLSCIKATKEFHSESSITLQGELSADHRHRIKELKEIHNPSICYTLRDIIKDKEEFDPKTCPSSDHCSAKVWLKEYVDHIHKLQDIYQNLTLRKIQWDFLSRK